MLVGRIGRPGLLGLAARTAVVAGTVRAVNGAMTRHQMNRAEESQAHQAYEAEQRQAAAQAAAAQAAAAQAAAAQAQVAQVAPPPTGSDVIGQLERLAALQQQGILTPEEFATQKAKILAG